MKGGQTNNKLDAFNESMENLNISQKTHYDTLGNLSTKLEKNKKILHEKLKLLHILEEHNQDIESKFNELIEKI